MSFRIHVSSLLVVLSLGAQAHGGAILREVYTNISGSSVASLTNHASYPNSPSSTNWITDLFETPVNVGDNYGQRVRGYILPPQSGLYTFWIASDDQSELWLSTNAWPATNYVRIANLTDWSNPREWTKYGSQQSSPIFLDAGKMYAIYALMKEGGGGDNLAVRWQLPDGTIQEPLPATYLLPPGGPFDPPSLTGQSETNVSVEEGGAVTFFVQASNLYPLAYQWRRNGTNISGAAAADYTRAPVSLADSGALFRCVITNALGSVTSAPVLVSVVPDTTPPAIASAYNVGSTLVYVVFSEPLESNSAVAAANYGLGGGVTVVDASLDAAGSTVTLVVSPLVFDAPYTLTASNVVDRAAASNAIAPGASWLFTARGFSPGAIGDAELPGLAYVTNGVDVTAAGEGFGGASDDGAFVYVAQTGDFDVSVRLQDIAFADAWARAGIMARTTLAADSDFSAVFGTPSIDGVFFEYRGAGSNLLLNAGFESGREFGLNPTNWNGQWYTAHALTNNSLLAHSHRTPAAARSGTWMLMTTNNVQDTGDNWHGTGQFFPCAPGNQFLFSAYHLIQSNLPSDHATFLKVEWYGSATNRLFINEVESERLAARQIAWTYSAITATAPDNAALGKAVFLYEDTDGATNAPAEKFLAYWDDAALKEGTAGSTIRSAGLPVNYPDTWLRLKRSGNRFIGYASYDGTRWTELGSVTNALPSTIYLGMAVSSHGGTQEAVTARFRDWGAVTGGTTGRQAVAVAEPPGPSSRRTGIVISEIMYNPAPRTDGKNIEFIELFNTTPLDVDLSGWRIGGDVAYTFPSGTVIRAGAIRVVARVPADLSAVYGITNALGPISGNLPNGDAQVSLYNELGALLLDLEYVDHHPWPAVADGVGPSLVLSRPSYGEESAQAWAPSARIGGSPGVPEPIAPSPYAAISINEVLAHTDLPQVDFVELFNSGDSALDLTGFRIAVNTNSYVLPGATLIPARGFVSFTETQMGFVIPMEGSRISLVDAWTNRVVDMVLLGATSNGVSSGRFPDGAPGIHELAAPTEGTNNAALLIRDIVINEIMFHHPSNEDADEYIELYNRGTSTVNIGNWRISDGITLTLPANTLVAPGGFLVVAANATNVIAKHPHLNATNTVGNFAGRLSDRSDRIALEMPEDPGLPTVNFVLVDEVVYNDGWGKWSDGDGSSLELIDAHADNRLEGNWTHSDESTKAPWTTVAVTGVCDIGLGPADTFQLFLLSDGECLVDNVVALRTTLNRITNNTFDTGLGGWTAQGSHMFSYWDSTNGVGGSGGLHIVASGGGDPGANRIDTPLSITFTQQAQATIQVSARWMAGHPDLLARLHGGWHEVTIPMAVPENLGTPGLTNSRAVSNAGPVVRELTHAPVLPAAGEDVVIRARVYDPDGIAAVHLDYRIDPSPVTNSVAMTNAGAGMYSATLGGQGAGTLVAFRVRAIDGAGSPATSVYPDIAAGEALVRVGEDDFESALGSYHLWLTQASIDAWTNAPKLSNEFWPATLVAGSRIIHNAGTHYRGSPFVRPSFDHPTGALCAYRVDVPKSDRFLGVDELNLDTLEPWRDNTRQRERTIFWMGNRIGLPGSHQRFVGMYLNGVRRGDVYADVFHVEGPYVESWYPDDPDGEIFKIDDWIEFTNSDFSFSYTTDKRDATLESFKTTGGAYKQSRYRWCWEKKSNGSLNDDYSPLFDLVDAINETNEDLRVARFSALADVKDWIKVMALRHAVGDWDGYGYARGKNGYLYKPTQSTWKMLLWDLDFGLGTPDSHAVDTSMFHEIADPVISNQFLGTPVFLRTYLQTMKEIVEGPMLFGHVDPFVDAFHEGMVLSGVAAYPPDDVKAWVGLRRNFLATQVSAWEAPFAVTSNGGADFATNVNYITLTGTAPLDVRTLRVNGVAYEPRWTTASNWAVVVVLAPGANALTVLGIDKDGGTVGGATDSINITYTGGAASPVGSLVINEIMYHPGGAGTEFVEIHNRSATHAFDLNDFRVDGVGLTFTGSVVVLPGQFAVLAGDALVFAAEYGAGAAGAYSGSLDDAGERIQLVQLNGTNADVLVDDVVYDDIAPWPVSADGAGPSLQLIDGGEDNNRVGNWAVDLVALCTPGTTNSVAQDLPSFPLIWLNELLATNTAGIVDNATNRDPWVELFSQESMDRALTNFYLTDTYTNLAKWNFPSNASVPSNGFRVVWLDNQTGQTTGTYYHVAFRPSTSNGTLALVQSNGTNLIIVDYMNHPTIGTNLSYGDYPDGTWTNRAIFQVPTPGASNSAASAPSVVIRINEFMADNGGTVLDPYGEVGDWVELYNDGTNSVDLADYGFTDNLSQPFKWRIPTGVVIEAKSFLVVWADSTPAQTNGVHASWALGKGGESIGLYKPDGSIVDAFTFTQQVTDVTEGRWPDGAVGIVVLGYPTPAAENVSIDNAAPTLDPVGNQSVDELAQLSFTVTATDTDTPPQVLTFTLDPGAPTNASITAWAGVFTWTPGEEQGPSTNIVTIRVTDSGYLNRTVAETITVTVAEVNQAPALGPWSGISMNPGSLLKFSAKATDGDIPTNTLVYSLEPGAPAGASVDAASGVFTWTPSAGQALSSNSIMISVQDDGSPVLGGTGSLVVVVTDAGQVFEGDVLQSTLETGLVVRWSAETGELYRVYYADDMVGSAWTELPGDVTATDTVAEKVDATTNALGQRFYRIIRLLP